MEIISNFGRFLTARCHSLKNGYNWKQNPSKLLQHNDVYVVNGGPSDKAEPDANKFLWRKQT